MKMSRWSCAVFFAATTALTMVMSPHASAVGVSYLDPVGGWAYAYDGTFDPGTGGLPDGFGSGTNDALDGTWDHRQGDKWDGTAPGDPLSKPGDPIGIASTPGGGPAGTSPGGAGAFTEGSTDYIRVQDTGNPEIYGWTQGTNPENNNRRVNFGRDLQINDGVADELILSSTGVTISFRVRIPDSGPLDDRVYLGTVGDDADFNSNLVADGVDFLTWQRNTGGPGAQSAGDASKNAFVGDEDFAIWEDQFGGETPGTIGWFEGAPNGRGTPMINGRGMINIVQNAPNDDDTLIGFSLVNSTDISTFCSGTSGALCTGSGSGGLIMNNLNGNIPTDDIDSASPGTLNILERTDSQLNEWDEYWITLENSNNTTSNIKINVYMNGSLTPTTFQATLAAPENATYKDEDNPFLEFGISANGGFGSFDLDFLSYKIGVITPVAALSGLQTASIPEPSSVLLLSLGALGLYGVRRRRSS